MPALSRALLTMAAIDPTWTTDATMRLLNRYPLPADFRWPHRDDAPDTDRAVRPVHGFVQGYGKWLRETPYYPGLFELIHDLLTEAPEEFDPRTIAPDLAAWRERLKAEPARPGEHLAQKIRRLRPRGDQPTLF